MINLILLFEFFKIGLFSVGGGLATIPFLYDLAARHDWFTNEMVLDMIAISESTPGPLGINMATYAGFHGGGVIGAVSATVGIITPSIIIIILIAKFLGRFQDNKYVQGAFYGIRPAVTALIAIAAFSIIKLSLFIPEKLTGFSSILSAVNVKSLILFTALLIVSNIYKKHPIVYILIGAACGILFRF
mgnify:FL=1